MLKQFKYYKSTILLAAISGLSVQSHANDLIISEYIEGSSNNKAIELYNPTDNSIDLSGYELQFYFNGNSTSTGKVLLEGNVAAGETFVIADDNAASEILTNTQQQSSSSFFNGDDAIVLINQSTVIDSIGQVGFDPGSEWGSGLLSTKDNTLRRNHEGVVADINISDVVTLDNWLGFEKDDFSDLGSFNGSITDPTDPSEPTDPIEPIELVCGEPATAIHTIQGNTETSPLVGEVVIVEAIVTSDLQAGLKGFFIQMPDAQVDADPQTSEAVFVYTDTTPISALVGDIIRLQATVKEYNGLTELVELNQHTICQTNQALPTIASIQLPSTDILSLEAYEGMLVSFEQQLVVNAVNNLGRYGEVELGSQRHFTGTQIASPGEDAMALEASYDFDRVILDDGQTAQNPEVILYPAPQLSALNTLRSGNLVTNLTGVLHYSFNEYRVMPTESVNIVAENSRTLSPELSGNADITVASYNVLNYFNGDGLGGGFPTSRGADSVNELERQQSKIISALAAIDADVFGLMEIENDGYESLSAIAQLVDALNNITAPNRYSYIRATDNRIGTDEIAVGIIYQSEKLTPVLEAKILDSANSPVDENGVPLFDDGKNRPMLTQMFSANSSGEQFVVAVNHLKSKGSNCDSVGDPDVNDGQGNCNLTRTRAAQAIPTWIAEQYDTNELQAKVLIIGDLNAYAKEDPLTALADSGYTELFSHFGNTEAYSYVYAGKAGQLDHALANETMIDSVVNITEWHINADEPSIIDYNEEYKSATQLNELYAADAYRSSDHDPMIVELQFSPINQAPEARFNWQVNGAEVLFTSSSVDDNDSELVHEWQFGDGNLANGTSTAHTFLENGSYHVTLTVSDSQGLVHAVTQTVEVSGIQENIIPIAKIRHVDFWIFDVFISLSSDIDGSIVSQLWQFNDGQSSNRRVVFKRGGNATSVSLTVTDNDAEIGVATLNY